MRCGVKNGKVRYHEFCENPPAFVVETLGLAYPSHALQTIKVEGYCLPHFVQAMTNAAVERTPTSAGFRIIRLEHWKHVEELRVREGRAIRGISE